MRLHSLVGWLAAAMLAGVAYLGATEVQSWRGRQALQATQLSFLTLDAALAASARSGQPVLADYSAIWCPACRALHQALADPALRQRLASRYVLARVDADAPEAERFRERYAVTGFPTLLVLDSDGRLLRRIAISTNPAELSAQL